MSQPPRQQPFGNRRRGLTITAVAAGCTACCAAPLATALSAIGLTLSMLIYPALLFLAAAAALILTRWRRHRKITTSGHPDRTADADRLPASPAGQPVQVTRASPHTARRTAVPGPAHTADTPANGAPRAARSTPASQGRPKPHQ